MVIEKEIVNDKCDKVSQGSFEQVQRSAESSTEDLTVQDRENKEVKDVVVEDKKVVLGEKNENGEIIYKCSCGKTIIGEGVTVTEPSKDLQPIKVDKTFNPKEWISHKERAVIQRALQIITSWAIKTIHSDKLEKKYDWIIKSNYLSERNFVNLYSDGEILKKLASTLTPKYKYDVVNVDQVIVDCMDLVNYNRLKFREYCVDVFGLDRKELFSLEDFNIKKSPKGFRNIFYTLCSVALKCDEMKLGTEFINCYVFVNMRSSILERRELGFDVYTCVSDMKHHIN
uniref:Calponin-homology (CH) domain-containing protein n=1 Tax=Strongyloides venezuelensis TaxID=75913 RepID=A0A0K0G1R6_STRVS